MAATNSPLVRQAYDLARRAANTDSAVLITGETGTGKEFVAELVHRWSGRVDEPFIKVNCAALPENLVESELFGYEKGAFTGAVTAKPGRFELADRGTLFLDEIGEMSPATQAKVLRVLQDGTFERVGGIRTLKSDVRLVSATHQDLERLVKAGKFREDLYYRIHVVPIALPPLRSLRSRTEDLPALADFFLKRVAARLKAPPKSLAPEALAALSRQAWPGNLRELANLMERLTVMAAGVIIGLKDLPAPLRETKASSKGELGEVKADLLKKVLAETKGNKTKAAQRLGVSRRTLHTWLGQADDSSKEEIK
jgi:two-component system response regulator HydG